MQNNTDVNNNSSEYDEVRKISWTSGGQIKEPKRPTRYIRKEVPKNKESKPKKPSYNLPTLFQGITEHLFNEDNIPDRITASYSDDYDILNVHDIVLCKLNHEKKDLPTLHAKRIEIEDRLEDQLKVIERRKLVTQLEEIKSKIKCIEIEEKKNRYIEETKDLLISYQKMGPIIRVRSFLESEDTSKAGDLDQEQEDRIKIIRKYIDIAKKYIPINVVRIIPNDRTCPCCGQDLVIIDPEDNSIERCEECGFERMNFNKPSFFKEGLNQTKTVSNSDYEDKENFIKALECYLGEQQPPNEGLFRALDSWAESYNHPSKEEILTMPLNEDGTRGEYGKSMLLQALADTGYADNYKDVKLIGHLHWGWKLPTLTQQERDIIIQDYDNTQKIFNAIPKERKSSLNTQYRLYRHLEARKHKIKPTDFKVPGTPSILEEHDLYWIEMVKVIPGAEFTSLK